MNKQNTRILFHKTVAYWGRPILYSIQPWHIGEDYFLEQWHWMGDVRIMQKIVWHQARSTLNMIKAQVK